MHRRRPPGSMEQRVLKRIIHVELGRKESRENKQHARNRRLEKQRAPIITEYANTPEQNDGQHNVEARKQPNPQSIIRIPHVFRSAHQVVTGQDSPGHIQAPEHSDERRKQRLARNKQGVPEPQSQASHDHANVAEVQHVLPAPGPGVKREPCEQPEECGPAKDGKRLCSRWQWPPSLPLANAPKRITGSNMELGQHRARLKHRSHEHRRRAKQNC